MKGLAWPKTCLNLHLWARQQRLSDPRGEAFDQPGWVYERIRDEIVNRSAEMIENNVAPHPARALCAWMEANRCINVDDLREHKKLARAKPHDQLHGRPFCRT